MQENNCNTIVFSSSATVYDSKKETFFKEDSAIDPINPYGQTKLAIEKVLRNIYDSNKKNWRIANLRYFNPIGAHDSGMIGESPLANPNNLFPLICQVASGKKKQLKIFGNDWPTIDGTCVRDYIHVMDIAEAHVSTLDYLFKQNY